jgi:hypothetical protein
MIAAVLPLAAAALDGDAMSVLVEHELGAGAIRRPAPDGPALVAHVLASNVPALALPAIALSCLAGAAVLVKSGRADPLSAPAFTRALAAVDPELAATVVTTYWAGGDPTREQALLGGADVVSVSGGDEAIAALARRVRGRLLTYGPRVSVAAIGRDALGDAARLARAAALQVALYDQRGCLSPRALFVETGGASAPAEVAEALATELGTLAERLPPGAADVAERAARRTARADAEWDAGAHVLECTGGTVIYEERIARCPTPGLRTVRVHPLESLSLLADVLPTEAIECVGLAGGHPADVAALLDPLGVTRLCVIDRMQRPSLAWPRGRHAPLGALLGRRGRAPLQIEA